MVVHPVDTVKIRMQLQGELQCRTTVVKRHKTVLHGTLNVYKAEGLAGIYKGTLASLARECSYTTIRLGFYEPFKYMLGATDPAHTPFWKKSLAGSMSGLIGSGIANPTDLIKVRMQSWEAEPRTLRWHVRYVYEHWGIAGFWKGVKPCMARAILVNAT